MILLVCFQAWAKIPVGKVSFARGSAAAQENDSGQPRLLGKDSEIFEGDQIQTGADSFVILEFMDGGRITVRPETHFNIAKYHQDQANTKGEIKLELQQGGIRAAPGSIAITQGHAIQLETPQGTAQSQGTEFTARLCTNDCQKENKNATALAAKLDEKSAGQVIKIHGVVSAIVASTSNSRELYLGSPVFEEDTLKSEGDSYAVLQFKDGGKYTVQENSEFLIAQYRFSGNDSPTDRAFLKLLSGGLRTISGAIGKTNRQAFNLKTPVATIGIRGTRFDLFCQGECRSDEAAKKNAPIEVGKRTGLYSVVWEGAISETNQAGVFSVGTNQSTYIANGKESAVYLKQIPDLFLKNPAPSPKDVAAPSTTAASSSTAGPGLYLAAHAGKNAATDVKFTTPNGQTVGLDSQKTFYVGGTTSAVMEGTSEFMMYDNHMPTPMASNPAVTYSLLRDSLEGTSLVYFCACH